MTALLLPCHAWTDTSWRPCPSLDAHAMSVRARWPEAIPEMVRSRPRTGYGCGVVHRMDGRIVAEVRDRNGRQGWEEWIATREQ